MRRDSDKGGTQGRSRRRTSPGDPAPLELDDDAIDDAALRLLRRGGMEGLSLAALAVELGVGAQQLRARVPTQEALVARVKDSVMALVPTVSGRARSRRRGEQRLSEQQIIDATLRFIRTSSADELSMRGLAKELNVSPMALYHHVPNKDALIARVIDSLLMQVPTPEPCADRWQEQMKAYALQGVRLLNEYPGLFSYRTSPPKSVRRLMTYGISVLLAAGFDERAAARALAVYHTHIFGLATMRFQFEHSSNVRVAPSRSNADPRMVQAARYLKRPNVDALMEYGIDTVLAGFAAQLESPAQDDPCPDETAPAPTRARKGTTKKRRAR